MFILAFFIGLYHDQTKPLIEDKAKRKKFGHPIINWNGVQDSRLLRKQYPLLRQYMFAALIARTDIDFIALDKGELTPRKAVDALVEKMEQYANFGFDYIKEKMEDDPNYFFKEMSFLRIFTSFIKTEKGDDELTDDDEPESLD